ncbi:MAG: ATP-binding protein [Bdellovibrionales bacterium]|nr:ATP-binding protein [Bdellovibrionales bacterium]
MDNLNMIHGEAASTYKADLNEDFIYENAVTAYSWFRLSFYSVAYLGVLFLQLLQGDFLCLEVWQPIHIIMFVGFLTQLLLILLAPGSPNLKMCVQATLIIDGLLLAAVMATMGFNHSLFLFVALVCVGISGLILGVSSAIKIGLIISGSMTLVYSLNYQFNPESLRAIWLINNTSLFIVAGLGGYLGDQFRFVSEDLEIKTEEVRALTDINEIIVDNIPSGLMVISSDNKVVSSNRGAAKIFGDLGLEGRPIGEIFADLENAITSLRSNPNASHVERYELNYYNYKNEKMILEVILSVINRKTSDHGQVLCLIQNLTEIKNLEFSMRQKEKLAAVGQLAAGIAHEIRNPLASISGSVQLLESSLQTQTTEDKKLLAIVIKEIDRLNKLVTEFLDFVRPDSRIEDPININNLAKEVLEMAKLNEKLSSKVEHRTELRAQSIVYGHYDKLKQALLNIIMNAYQAMHDTLRPEIYIQTIDQEGSVILIIQDNGVGMTQDNLKRIFEPFHTTKPQGTGLGMAITHKIIETHNAEIFVESELGLGTKFIIKFPAKNSPDTNKMYLKKQA